MKDRLLIVMVVASFALAACGQPQAAGVAGSESGGECPAAEAGMQTLTNEAHGYCLLYPDGYDVTQPNEDEIVFFVGSLLDVEHPRAMIIVQDAGGVTTTEAADELQAEFEGFDVARSTVMIGGEEAVVLDNLPGQDINRRLVVVHNDRVYDMMFIPVGESYGEISEQMEILYSTIVDSFTFLP